MLYSAYCDEKNRIYKHESLKLVARSGNVFEVLSEDDVIPLPKGSNIMRLPNRTPVGLAKDTNSFVELNESTNDLGFDVAAAILPQGYLRTYLPAYVTRGGATNLPLYGYTALGFKDDELVVAAKRTDVRDTWNPQLFNTHDLKEKVKCMTSKYPKNRIISQLSYCALEYGCFTAQNFIYGRNEGGLPTSPVCNANCLGCISLQPSECCLSPQQRIKFIPTEDEIVEVMLEHLGNASDPIISFGQGCEGEPSLSYKVIVPAIRKVRSITKRGTINMNTNAGNTQAIRELIDAGIDSFRVSMISANDDMYGRYHVPNGYSLQDVVESIKNAKSNRVFVSLNYLVFPGFTDLEREVNAMAKLIDDTKIDMIQLRNLNMDPEKFISIMLKDIKEQPCGMAEAIQYFYEAFPNLLIGNFSVNLS